MTGSAERSRGLTRATLGHLGVAGLTESIEGEETERTGEEAGGIMEGPARLTSSAEGGRGRALRAVV